MLEETAPPQDKSGTLTSEGALAAEPCTLVIFGGSGDLAKRKLIPALYNLSLDGVLPEPFAVVGVGRKDMDDDSYREFLRGGIEKFSRQSMDSEHWENFAQRISYHRGALDNPESYRVLGQHVREVELEYSIPGNHIFYLSIPPALFSTCAEQLRSAGLVTDLEAEYFTRIIVEKPIGNDLASAEEVNDTLASVFDESQTYRIDHYLGKETVQNILVMRFGNAIFEPLWNQKYIDHVQITVSEEEGVGTRAGYYEDAGALRDMVQNHILQVLCLTAMEPPRSLAADVIRDRKLEVLQSLRPVDRVERVAVRAQYGSGYPQGESVPGYRQEDGVDRESTTETYVALKVFIDNWRWADVPFFIRTGKRLGKRASEISVHFKEVPHTLFNQDRQAPLEHNVLALRIQPDEGFSLRISSKQPGPRVSVDPVEMDFRYGSEYADPSPEAYERLLLDVMAGDATLFMRRDAVEASWRWIEPILHAWEASPERWLPEYAAGTWGPVEAERLIHGHRRMWRIP